MLGVESRHVNAAVFLERLADVLDVDVVPREVDDVAFLLVLTRAVDAADGLNRVDVRDFLFEEERVQLWLVKARLKLVDDDHQSVLGILEVLDDLGLAVAPVHRRAGLVFLVIAVDDADGCVRVPRVERLLAPLTHHLADAIAIVDGERNGRDGQHGLACAVDLAVDETDEPVDDEVRDLLHAVAVAVDLRLVDGDCLILGAWVVIRRNPKVDLADDGNDVLGRIEDVPVINGLLHRVGIERNPGRNDARALELAEPRQNLFCRRRREADDEVLLVDLAAALRDRTVDAVLQFLEEIDHLLVAVARVRAVDLVDEKGDAHLLQGLVGLVERVLKFKELLNIDNDDALEARQRRDELVLVRDLREHALVNVHGHHHCVDLVAKLEPVDDNHHLVERPFPLVPEILELQGRPADDVALAEARRILEEERIDVLVVAVAVAVSEDAFKLFARHAERLEFLLETLAVEVGFFLMLQHFADASEDAVAAELLLGTRRNERTAMADAHLVFLTALALVLVFVLKKVVVEDLALDHLLGVERMHDLDEPLLVRQQFARNWIYLEHLFHVRLELRDAHRVVGKALDRIVVEAADGTDDVGLVHVRRREMDALLEHPKRLAAVVKRGRVCLGTFGHALDAFKVVADDLAASLHLGRLSVRNALQLHVADEDSVEEE